MFIKNQSTWERNINYEDTLEFKSLLDKLKTYSKCFNSSTYSVTSTLMDVYKTIKFQHCIWIQLTNFAPEFITLFELEIKQGYFYNLLKYVDIDTILKSDEFRKYLELGWIKAATSKLFEDDMTMNPRRLEWFCSYEPRKLNYYINKPFDYLVIRYTLKDSNSKDLDTRTSLVNTFYQGLYKEDNIIKNSIINSLDGNDIGWSRGSEISSTSGKTYIKWGGDNTTSIGGETILIDFKEIGNNLSYLENIQTRLRAFFYRIKASGKIELEAAAYKDGIMVHVGTDFQNVGGTLVQSIKTDRIVSTQNSSNINGDDLGTVVYNIESSNVILTDLLNTEIVNNNFSFNDLLNYIDFNAYVWQMGTSGYSAEDPNYTDMLISNDFTEEKILEDFQDSYVENGYTEKNYFTSEKTWNKLLSHFYVIDVATTEHIDISDINNNPIPYPLIDIDGIRIINEHRVLFKNQNNAYQNGIYLYKEGLFTRDEIFNTDDDLNYFSCFIKEGRVNKNKEFFLDTKEDGIYPSFNADTCGCKCNCADVSLTCPLFIFKEGNNYVLRNRSSYKLLADHIFTDSEYFIQQEPITDFDYTYRYYDNGTNFNLSGTGFFEVNINFNKLGYSFDGNLLYINNAGTNASDKLNPYINVVNKSLYLLRNKKEVVKFNSFTAIPNKDIFNSIITLNKNYSDFELVNSTTGYFLEDINSTQGVTTLDYITFTNNSFIINDTYELVDSANDIAIIDSYIFYLTYDGIYLYFNNKNYKIRDNSYPTRLRVKKDGNDLVISYLINDIPEIIKITNIELNSLLSWTKNEDYEVVKFSKIENGDWKIVSNEGTNNLFLKDVQITNLAESNYFINVSKILSSNSRYFDGLEDYSDLNLSYDDNTNNTFYNKNLSLSTLKNTQISQGSFTLEFKINPEEIRVNQTPIYFGDRQFQYSFKLGKNLYKTQVKPNNYISFILDNGNGFPAFIVKKGSKNLIIVSNQKINTFEETHISFIWNYTTNKAFGELYFNGKLVGSFIDQKTSSTTPIDVRTFSFDRAYFGKSEITAFPKFKGYMREVRLWNKVLNNSQITTRIEKSINKDNGNFINDLIGYWKLDDDASINYNLAQGNNFYKTVNEKLSITSASIFIGGLNNNLILREIQNPKSIQLDDKNLYLLDSKKYEEYTILLNKLTDITTFTNITDVHLTSDPATTSVNASCIKIDTNTKYIEKNITNSNRYGVTQTIQQGDFIEVEVETYFNDKMINSTGGGLSILYGTDGDFMSLPDINMGIWSTASNVWTKINVSLLAPINIDEVYIKLQINENEAYFRNLKYKITRINEIYNIYTIDLFKEKVSRIRSSYNIDSIYLEIRNLNNFNKFYTLENNDVYMLNSNTLFSLFDQSDVNVNDFTVINDKIYYLDSNYNVWDGTNSVIYTESSSFNIETLYGFDDTNINKTVIYIKDNNDNINILSRNILSNSNLDYKSTYPIIIPTTLEFESIDGNDSVINFLKLEDNKVYYNNNELDTNQKQWNLNLKNILGIYKKDNNTAFILSNTLYNELKLWIFKINTQEIIKVANYKNETTLFVSENKNIGLIYYTIDKVDYFDEWIVINDDKEIYFYQLEKNNKIDFKKLVQRLDFQTEKVIKNLYKYSDKSIWMSLLYDETEYLSTLSNTNNDYNLWNDATTYTNIETGWLIGESGILFKDVTNKGTNGTAFMLEYVNIIYKDNLNAIDAVKVKYDRERGYKVTEWSGIVYLVGDLGRIIKTEDNGATWKVLTTDNYSDFKGVSFFNEKNGLIVGLNNTILATFSGGDSFVNVEIPLSIGIRDWYDVKFYDTNRAIVVGSLGTIIHLTKSNFVWKVDKILNNIPLSELNVSIKSSDLDDYIKLEITKENDKDLYRQTIRSIEYLGNDEFLLAGDNNLLNHLRLSSQIGYIIPYLNFLQSNIISDWIDIKSYNDIAKNEKRAFIINRNNVYNFEWNRFNQNDNINIESIDIDLFQENSENIRTIALADNNLISAGRRVSAYKKELFLINNDEYILVDYIENNNFSNNAITWIQYNNDKLWNINNPSISVDLSTSNISKSKMIYTNVNLELNKTYTFNFNFTIPLGGYLEIVYADTLSNLLSGNYLLVNTYSFPISPFIVTNTLGIAYIGIIAHATLNTSSVFNINTISITNYEFIHNAEITYSSYIEKEDLVDTFKPRMLFLDYYMGRKINIHMENGNFVTPIGKLDKSKLECFYFQDGEYIELTDYGTVDNQNNYLAYQDHYMLNRRILDQPNSWGKTQTPYNKYNKRMTAIDNYLSHAVWEGELSTHGSNSNSNGFQFSNESVTDLEFYKIGDLREDSYATKLRLAWNDTTNTYSTTGLVAQSILIFSDFIIDNNTHRYVFRTNGLLGLVAGDLVKLDFSDILYYVRTEYNSSGNNYLEVDGIIIPTPNYTGSITKVTINFIETINVGDVVNIVSIDKDRNIELVLGDKVYLEIKADTISLSQTSIVQKKDDVLYYLEFTFSQFDTTFEVVFAAGSTIDEVLLDLKKETSAPVQIAKALMRKRCVDIQDVNYEILELNVFNFSITNKTLSDITLNNDNNKLYVTTSDKKLFVVDIDDNNVTNIVNLTTPSKFNTYNPYFKYLYVSGGDSINKTFDIVNTITNIKIATIYIGDTTLKPFYNPFNKLMYIPTNGNKCFLYNGVSQVGIINSKINDIIYVEYNNYIYTISSDNIVRIYNDTTLLNSIIVGNNLLKMKYDKNENNIYITSTTGIYVLNIFNNLVDFISVPKGISYTTGFELIDFVGKTTISKAILVTNANVTDTNFYITVIDRNTKSFVKEIYTDISVRDIKFNISENLIYLAGKTGQILLINPSYDLTQLDVNLDIPLYNIQSGQISSLFFNDLNNRIYPIKSQTYEISYLLTDKLEPANVNINLNTLSTDITTIVRNISSDNKITFWDLFTDEMVYELNSTDKKLIIKNLNYFDGDLLTLKNNFDKHLLGNSYNITINEEKFIIIEGYVNDLTKYYNLETFVKYATYGTDSVLDIEIVPVKYDKDIIYGANYSILSFLKNLNSTIFNENYSFNLPVHSFNYEPLYRTALGEFKEFSITNNRIYIGNDLINILDFKIGTFVDITTNNKFVTRVYIKDIIETTYTNYPDKKRYIINTDKALETNLDLVGLVTLRTRDTLYEISMDLEFTDDLMFPLSNGGSNAITLSNNTYYNNQVTSFEYAKILLNDDNIRRYVSSIVHLDKDSDWTISVINWKDDPNFFYRPLELFEVGVDRVFKKSITIDSSNYLVKGNSLELMNVDFNKYNYKIVDGMTLKELEEKYYWVLNADIRNAIIGEDTSGFVWYQGDWICGTWEEGMWYSGKAYNIEWLKGNVYSYKVVNNYNLISTIDDNNPNNTIWYKSIWYSGNWWGGTWNNGVWTQGDFNGIWNGGVWTQGIWNGGEFNGGEWLSGTWLSGNFTQNNSFSVWHTGTWLGGDFENGTWKTGIFDQTDRLPSRFGTKASLLNMAIWEYGWWKNGEFHSGLNIDSVTGLTLPSPNYKYSMWYNGTWERGIFYGGQWEMGCWKNGVWENGYLKSNLEIKEWRVRTSDVVIGKMVEVEFVTPHYFKDLVIGVSDLGNLIKLENSFVILGEPEITEGQIHPNTELLGYNTNAIKHKIIEILDDKTVLININDEKYPYEIEDGTSGYVENLDLRFDAGTNYLIDTITYSNVRGSNKERMLYANKNLTILNPYSSNTIVDYTWSSKTPTINLGSIAKPADIFWHKKSNKTFITSGYDNASFINNTSLKSYDNNNTLLSSTTMNGVNFISYDNVNDLLVLTSRCLIDSSSSGNANKIYFVNPYDITNVGLNISNINSDIVNNAVLNKPFVNQGISFYSIKYNNQLNQNKSALLRIDNKTSSISHSIINSNNTTELEGWDRNRNIIVTKESSSGTNFLYEINTLFNNKTIITSSTSGYLFSKYLENKKELFIIDDNILYSWDSKLTKIYEFDTKINSIMWSNDYNAYFIACDEGVKVLSINKKDILYTYNIPNALDFAYNSSDDEKIYVASDTKLYLIMDDICKNICTDYSVFIPELIDSVPFEIQKFQYKGEPMVASQWIDGKFKRGIWDYGYWINGLWQGGIWIDGVYENGIFGTD
jgi:hypothetical protein